MKVLVACADYPNLNNGKSLMYVHTRNLYYCKNGIEVTVLNFSTAAGYEIDNIPVISLKEFSNTDLKYDILICHAANLRNHLRFIKKYGNKFKRYVFFFHGHEVLKINTVYSKPFPYIKRNWIRERFQDIYDSFKLKSWRTFYKKNYSKCYFIFVSIWMKNQFLKWTRLSEEILFNRSSIIYNGIGECFQNNHYCISDIKYDYITIRGNIDGSKYGIDIVNSLAKYNSNKKFLVIGKGRYFDYYKKADNLTYLDTLLSHDEIIFYLNQSRCALMPTRTDAQGLMMCEMATFGIPVITSDIDVCHEVLEEFDNVAFINNDDTQIDLENIFYKIEGKHVNNNKFYLSNTCQQEIDIIKKL